MCVPLHNSPVARVDFHQTDELLKLPRDNGNDSPHTHCRGLVQVLPWCVRLPVVAHALWFVIFAVVNFSCVFTPLCAEKKNT